MFPADFIQTTRTRLQLLHSICIRDCWASKLPLEAPHITRNSLPSVRYARGFWVLEAMNSVIRWFEVLTSVAMKRFIFWDNAE
jgi:hypothetical protein